MTNTIAALPHLLMVAFVAAGVVARLLVLPLALDHWRLTSALAFGGGALVLKDPTLAPLLVERIGAVDLRLVVHLLVMSATMALAGLPGAWRWERPGAQRSRYALVLAMGVAMWFLAAPARGQGAAVEVAGGWRSVAYFSLFAASAATGLATVTAAYLRQRRRHGGSLGALTAALAVLALMAVDALTLLASAVLRAFGLAPAAVSAKQASNGWLFAVLMVAGATVCLRPAVEHVRRRAGDDGLRALWALLTAHAPHVVLPRTHALSPPMRRLRMEAEVVDALRELEPYLGVEDVWRSG